MSLYNMLHGVNPISPILLAILGIDQKGSIYSSGRFRDIHLDEKGEKIILYTRNGGGNREEYQPLIDVLATHPNYLTDYDDDFDCTYAYIEFSVPEKAKEFVKSIMTGEKPKTIHEKFAETIKNMEGMTKEQFEQDERFKPITEIFNKIQDSENKQQIFEV